MINSVAEAYSVYLAELDAYRQWTEGRKAAYGQKSSPIESWGSHDYERIKMWNKELNAMEKVLALSAEEIKQACTSVGITIGDTNG
jgi:hypothetical protein